MNQSRRGFLATLGTLAAGLLLAPLLPEKLLAAPAAPALFPEGLLGRTFKLAVTYDGGRLSAQVALFDEMRGTYGEFRDYPVEGLVEADGDSIRIGRSADTHGLTKAEHIVFDGFALACLRQKSWRLSGIFRFDPTPHASTQRWPVELAGP